MGAARHAPPPAPTSANAAWATTEPWVFETKVGRVEARVEEVTHPWRGGDRGLPRRCHVDPSRGQAQWGCGARRAAVAGRGARSPSRSHRHRDGPCPARSGCPPQTRTRRQRELCALPASKERLSSGVRSHVGVSFELRWSFSQFVFALTWHAAPRGTRCYRRMRRAAARAALCDGDSHTRPTLFGSRPGHEVRGDVGVPRKRRLVSHSGAFQAHPKLTTPHYANTLFEDLLAMAAELYEIDAAAASGKSCA